MLSSQGFNNTFSQLPAAFYSKQPVLPLTNPVMVASSEAAAGLLDITLSQESISQLTAICSGNVQWPGAEPLAMVYSGHQFGGYSPQLGDGRGLLLGEMNNKAGEKWDLHLKGAGPTPYSRFGDGRAVLRSCIREYLCSEAMHHLGIPTTRALCVVTSDTPVYREKEERGSTLLRLATTHIRFGHFEYFNYTNQHNALKTLVDYTVKHHFPHIEGRSDGYALFFADVLDATAQLIARWQAVGFAHGVMNTDNMSIVGETLDYGPYGFMDDFDWQFVCNHSDSGGRYAFGQQPDISYWNCGRLGAALMPLFDDPEVIQRLLNTYPDQYSRYYTVFMGEKLGLSSTDSSDSSLIKKLLNALQSSGCDYTRFFRALCDFVPGGENRAIKAIVDTPVMNEWLQAYEQRLCSESMSVDARRHQMKRVNPKFILRNYLAQAAIMRAEKGDYLEIERLMTVLQAPFDEHPAYSHYADSPPESAKKMLVSCSS